MPATLIQYQFDKTGISTDNLVEDELHPNIDSLAKLILPKHGRFFTESLIVKQTLTSLPLVKNTDYVVAEYDQQTSLLTGKEICGSILIINDTLGDDYVITYQALGGDFGYANTNLLEVLQTKILPNLPIAWEEITDKPVEFNSGYHLHDIDEVYGFEYIVKELNKIKIAIELDAYASFDSLVTYCENILVELSAVMTQYLDEHMSLRLNEFKAGINKVFFKIEELQNLSSSREVDGFEKGNKSYQEQQLTLNKYMTLDALIGLKKILFQSLVEKQKTGLGLTRATFSPPTRQTLFSAPIGGVTSFVTKRSAVEAGIPVDLDVYPSDTQIFTEIAIRKLSTNNTNNAGLFLAYDSATMGEYTAALETTVNTEKLKWRKRPTSFEEDPIRSNFEKHLVDFNSPHGITKFHVGLGLVEDLSIVTYEEILALKSTHKYITFDGLLKFIEAYILENNTDLRPAEKESPKYLIDNCVVVYSPAGQGCPTDTANNDCVDPPVLPPTSTLSPPITTRAPTTTPVPTTTAPPPTFTTTAPQTTTLPPTTTAPPPTFTTTAPPPTFTTTAPPTTIFVPVKASNVFLGNSMSYTRPGDTQILNVNVGGFTPGFNYTIDTYISYQPAGGSTTPAHGFVKNPSSLPGVTIRHITPVTFISGYGFMVGFNYPHGSSLATGLCTIYVDGQQSFGTYQKYIEVYPEGHPELATRSNTLTLTIQAA